MTRAAPTQEWESRIAAWRASGQSSEKFARSHGFSPQRLRLWEKRLSETAAPRFLQLVKRVPPAVAAPAAAASVLVIEVGSARIRVDSSVDDALLRRVVHAIGGER